MRRIRESNRSITWQVFFTILPIFLLILVLQMIYLTKYFTPVYRESMLRDIRAEFRDLVEDYSNGSEYEASAVLRAYTEKYETPVLVFGEDYQIKDHDFFDHMSILTIRDTSQNMYKLPIAGLSELAKINFSENLYVQALRIGESEYYEPIQIRSDAKMYLYRQNPDNLADKTRLTDFDVRRCWYTEQGGNPTNNCTYIIYGIIKDCLINRTDIRSHLESISKEPFTEKSGTTYQIITDSISIDGVETYFVTIRPIVFSGSEAKYFNKYFYSIFALFGLLLITVVYFLSKRLSSPIVSLSEVAQKLAAQDFSVRAAVNSQNEVGRLSSNINLLADNLQQAIVESQQSAEAAHTNEARMKSLLADLAHEFKTPLGIISLYAEVIEKRKFEKEPEYYFRIIEHEIENLTQMIDETIQLTKMYAGYWEYRPAPVALDDLIEIALSRFSEKLNRDQFNLDVRLLDVTVIADARRIEQVLTNFISNAIKYSGEKKSIEVDVVRNGQTVTVSISNYGHVSAQDLSRIWERYYQAAEDTAAHLPSQGIGLEIAREILMMHSSEYGVRQEEDKICFYFTLPIADE